MQENQTVTYNKINAPTIRNKLVSGMAICTQPERTFRHQMFDVLNPKHVIAGKIELEVETSRISILYTPLVPTKTPAQQPQNSLEQPHSTAVAQHNLLAPSEPRELTLGVSDFDTAHALLIAMGLHARSFQEVKREVWEIGKVQVAIETWPWLDPILIIGAATRDGIDQTAAFLNLSNEQIYEGTVSDMYRDSYGIDESMFYNTPSLMFMVRPSWLQAFDAKVHQELMPATAEELKHTEGGVQIGTTEEPTVEHTDHSDHAEHTETTAAKPDESVPGNEAGKPQDKTAENTEVNEQENNDEPNNGDKIEPVNSVEPVNGDEPDELINDDKNEPA